MHTTILVKITQLTGQTHIYKNIFNDSIEIVILFLQRNEHIICRNVSFNQGFHEFANISTNTHFLRFRHRKDSSVVNKPDLLMYYSQTRKFGLGTRIARSNRLGKTFQDLSRISIPNCMIFVEILVFPSNPVHPAKFFSRVFSPNLF